MPAHNRERSAPAIGQHSATAAATNPEPMRVFVASSSEQIDVAKCAADALASPQVEVKVWDEETFDFSASYMQSLEKELDRADFAVVILTADDTANVRSKKVNLPRDNVIFELGLFTGRLGRDRCFFLVDGTSDTKVASDLSGIAFVTFYPESTSQGSGRPSLPAQMRRLRKQMLKQDVRYKPSQDARADQQDLWRFSKQIAGHWWERIRAGEDGGSAISYVTISVDELTNTPRLRGTAYDLQGGHAATWETLIAGAILKDRRIHYRWEGEEEKEVRPEIRWRRLYRVRQ